MKRDDIEAARASMKEMELDFSFGETCVMALPKGHPDASPDVLHFPRWFPGLPPKVYKMARHSPTYEVDGEGVVMVYGGKYGLTGFTSLKAFAELRAG